MVRITGFCITNTMNYENNWDHSIPIDTHSNSGQGEPENIIPVWNEDEYIKNNMSDMVSSMKPYDVSKHFQLTSRKRYHLRDYDGIFVKLRRYMNSIKIW